MKFCRDLNESQRDHIVEHPMDLIFLELSSPVLSVKIEFNSTCIAKLTTLHLSIISSLFNYDFSSLFLSVTEDIFNVILCLFNSLNFVRV